MKINKYILMASALLMGAAAYADDFDSFGDFGDFGGDSSSAASALEVNGSVETEIRAYVDTSDKDDKDGADKIDVSALPNAKLDMKYSGNKSDVEIKFKVDEDTIKNHPEDVIDEAVLRGYFGNLTLEAGKMKVVWGKGDKLHVLDNFNSDDYSDFIIPDYLDRRISTPMVRAVYSLPFANMNLEGLYTPLLPVDRFATNGRWTPAQVSALSGGLTASAKAMVASSVERLENARMEATQAAALKKLMAKNDAAAQAALSDMVTSALSNGKISYTTEEVVAVLVQQGKNPASATAEEMKAAAAIVLSPKYAAYLESELTAAETAYTLALANANSLSANPDVIYPNLNTLKYSQYGARATWTMGQLDMGISYYNGWYKQPSINGEKAGSFLTSYLANGKVAEEDKFLAYDKKQTFGLEASSIIWHFNVRGEFAYNLTEDTEGTDPWVHNNSIGWLGGFDIDLPFWNANLNVQETGAYILNGDECDKNKADVDYDKTGYTNNKLVCNVTTSFINDKLAPEVTVMYGIERGDLVIMPKLAIKPDQNLTLTASGMIINCADEDSEFYNWRKNSFVSLGAKYQF